LKKKIVIVGGGACALMLACELDPEKFHVSIYEKNAAPGRKFLVAGDGGLNITHSENEGNFISRYTPRLFFEKAFSHFSNRHLVKWFNDLGIETYTGSSGRVFPKRGIKPIDVLNTILAKIKNNGVSIFTKHHWNGFSQNGNLIFEHHDRSFEVTYDYVIFCLGGASWPVTGSSGSWSDFFREKKIRVHPFMASNCTFKIHWPPDLVPKIEGRILKNISISCENKTHLGEVVLTRSGIEGSGIYPLSPEIRKQLEHKNKAEIHIDLKPNLALGKIWEKLQRKPAKVNTTDHLKTELHLSELQITLLKYFLSKEDFLNTTSLSKNIKQLTCTITGTASVEDAISTVGGIALEEINEIYELKKMPGHFAVGEMLDYDAPTGGYLLQSCFSMAKYLADHLNSNNP
jgi:uncharacterized flavoprotein (TIGR03862 family)